MTARIAAAAIAGLLATAALPVWAQDMLDTTGLKPWDGCGECHSLDGVSPNGHFPSLAAQNQDYLIKQIEDFRAGARTNDHGQMGTSTRELSPEQIGQTAAYFSALPVPPPVLAVALPAPAAARARQIVEIGSKSEKIPACSHCHGPNPDTSFRVPRLEAQQPAYLAKELREFKSEQRSNDPKGVMRTLARRLSDVDIDAIADYLGSRPRLRPGRTADQSEDRRP